MTIKRYSLVMGRGQMNTALVSRKRKGADDKARDLLVRRAGTQVKQAQDALTRAQARVASIKKSQESVTYTVCITAPFGSYMDSPRVTKRVTKGSLQKAIEKAKSAHGSFSDDMDDIEVRARLEGVETKVPHNLYKEWL